MEKIKNILTQQDLKDIHSRLLYCYQQDSKGCAHQEFLSEDRELMRKVLELEKQLFSNPTDSASQSEPVAVRSAEEIFKSHMDKFRSGLFKASLDYYLETGIVSGSLLLTAREMFNASQFKSPETEVHNKAIDEAIASCNKAMRQGFSILAFELSLKNLKK